MHKFINLLLYFFIAVILIGSMGIWLPILLGFLNGDDCNMFTVVQNSTTYFISIAVSGCVQLTAQTLKGNSRNKLGYILLFILIILIFIAFVVFNSIQTHRSVLDFTKWITSIGIIGAYILWWVSNSKDGGMNAIDALG